MDLLEKIAANNPAKKLLLLLAAERLKNKAHGASRGNRIGTTLAP